MPQAIRYTIDYTVVIEPTTPQELAQALASCYADGKRIRLTGQGTKAGMGGPVTEADVSISTRGLNRVLQYEPRDLTVSVESGASFSELTALLAQHRQMLPLDPPFGPDATVGGVLASNQSGPRRRLYGTARDMVIGMTLATLEGKLVKTGGMVVKNVAGLDLSKLMVGSFGTLAAMAVVNFKVAPIPPATRSFVRRFKSAGEAMAARDYLIRGVLQPAAIDVEKGADGYRLLVQAGGNAAVLDRYSREFSGAEVLEGEAEEALWRGVREFTPEFLKHCPEGAVVRISCSLTQMAAVLDALPGPAIARAGSGVVYGCFERAGDAAGRELIEFAPQAFRENNELWAAPGDDFATMQRVKGMLDPRGLLNRGRLFGRI